MRVRLRVTHHSSTLHPSDLRHPTGARVRNVSEDPLSLYRAFGFFSSESNNVPVMLAGVPSARAGSQGLTLTVRPPTLWRGW